MSGNCAGTMETGSVHKRRVEIDNDKHKAAVETKKTRGKKGTWLALTNEKSRTTGKGEKKLQKSR